MRLNIKKIVKFSLFMLVTLICVISYFRNYKVIMLLTLLLFIFILVSHTLLDLKISRLFVSVIFLFALSYILRISGSYIEKNQLPWMYLSYLPWFFAYLLILGNMLTNNSRFKFNKYAFITLLIVGINIWICYKLINDFLSYNLDNFHLLFFLVFTIIEMILLSLGVLFYLTSTDKYKKISFLNLTIVCLLLKELIDITTSLYFGFDIKPIFRVLDSFLLCSALLFFYMYCTYPELLDQLGQE